MARGGLLARTAALTAVVVLAGAGMAGCGDDSGGTGEPKKTPKPQPSSSASSAPAGGGGGAPADKAVAEKEIKENWQKLFDPKTPIKEKPDYLEDGDEMQPLMDQMSNAKELKQVAAKVTKVTFTSPEKAEVKYALTLNGETAVPNTTGTAVLQDGTWKVSKNSICALISLSGSPAPGC
ncbi:hypothetical protein G5C51_25960 [Streptomyces sp. A7024]|uniref:Low molecular weight antigen MTB12-like C-terminal domain-containing protein n=1 Tax=Streptomyces coryli TaxID=1128680 RepID=A0A6G4U6J8_9ACTN|nr:hypothetical protein [Streptomyces coryli]NGN67336.1 hypothetical protein [Streptomyces coryli]